MSFRTCEAGDPKGFFRVEDIFSAFALTRPQGLSGDQRRSRVVLFFAATVFSPCCTIPNRNNRWVPEVPGHVNYWSSVSIIPHSSVAIRRDDLEEIWAYDRRPGLPPNPMSFAYADQEPPCSHMTPPDHPSSSGSIRGPRVRSPRSRSVKKKQKRREMKKRSSRRRLAGSKGENVHAVATHVPKNTLSSNTHLLFRSTLNSYSFCNYCAMERPCAPRC